MAKQAKKKSKRDKGRAIEDIFAHAQALTQSGRLRNTVYCIGKKVYILNQDFTVLIRFHLRKNDVTFSSPVSFLASDYDSKEFIEEDGRIKFITRTEKYIKTKSCRTPDRTPKEVEELFDRMAKPKKNKVLILDDIFDLLDDNLSHIEFSAKKERLMIVQRDIYSGALITIKKEKPKEGLGVGTVENLPDFERIGIRTQDFAALYSFSESLQWSFGNNYAQFGNVDKRKLEMSGIISCCIYDELGREEK